MMRASSSSATPSTPTRSPSLGERRVRSPQSSRTDRETLTPPLSRRRLGDDVAVSAPRRVATALPTRNELLQARLLRPVPRTPNPPRGGQEDGQAQIPIHPDDEDIPTMAELTTDFDIIEAGIDETEDYKNFSQVSEQVQNWMVAAQCGISFPKDIVNLSMNAQYHSMLKIDGKFNILGFPFLSPDGITIRKWGDLKQDGVISAQRIRLGLGLGMANAQAKINSNG